MEESDTYISDVSTFKDLERVSKKGTRFYSGFETIIEGRLGEIQKKFKYKNNTPQEIFQNELDSFFLCIKIVFSNGVSGWNAVSILYVINNSSKLLLFWSI